MATGCGPPASSSPAASTPRTPAHGSTAMPPHRRSCSGLSPNDSRWWSGHLFCCVVGARTLTGHGDFAAEAVAAWGAVALPVQQALDLGLSGCARFRRSSSTTCAPYMWRQPLSRFTSTPASACATVGRLATITASTDRRPLVAHVRGGASGRGDVVPPTGGSHRPHRAGLAGRAGSPPASPTWLLSRSRTPCRRTGSTASCSDVPRSPTLGQDHSTQPTPEVYFMRPLAQLSIWPVPAGIMTCRRRPRATVDGFGLKPGRLDGGGVGRRRAGHL